MIDVEDLKKLNLTSLLSILKAFYFLNKARFLLEFEMFCINFV